MKKFITSEWKRIVAYILVGLIIFGSLSVIFIINLATFFYGGSCHKEVKVLAWADTDGNGIWDEDEPPLPLVDLEVDYAPEKVKLKTRVSGSDGVVLANITGRAQQLIPRIPFLHCGDLGRVKIRPITPDGYTAIEEESQLLRNGLTIGFKPTADAKIPSIQPTLSCDLIRVNGNLTSRQPEIEVLLPQTERTVMMGWSTSPWQSILVEYEIKTGELQQWDTTELFGEEQKILDIKQGPNDVVWVHADRQIVSKFAYEDATWQLTPLPSPFNWVLKIATDSAGRLWVVSAEGIARWDSTSQTWVYFDSDLPNILRHPDSERLVVQITNFEILSSGQLVLGNPYNVTIVQPDEARNEVSWQYLERPTQPFPRVGILTVDDNDRIWFNQMQMFYDAKTGEWHNTQFQSQLANNEPRYFIGVDGTIVGDGLWVNASENVLFYVDHYDQADWTQWPLYRMDHSISNIVLESPDTIWISGYNAIKRCQVER